MKFIKHVARRVLHTIGFDVVRYVPDPVPSDVDPFDVETIGIVRPYTMTSALRVLATCEAIRYVVRSGISGDFVECGAWRGGNTMAAARTLLHLGDCGRDLYLYDTFEGMPPPDDRDLDPEGRSAAEVLAADPKGPESMFWCVAGRTDVERAVLTTGYPSERVRLVVGKVEETIPGVMPERIAVLRLDTDWYASTRHELVHLFPRLSQGGVLILDDYGYWKGARLAVDEFLRSSGARLMLHRIDWTGRMAIKVDS
jgi:hypothetical protein